MRRSWTYKEEQFLRDNYPVTPTRELTRLMNRSHKAISSRAKILRLRKAGDMARRYWTKKEDNYLVLHYPDSLTDDIGNVMGRNRSSIYARAKILGLEKSKTFKLSEHSGRFTGNQGKPFRFEKGHIPANKGKKMSPEQYEKARPTMFRKGQNPKNTKYDGCVTVRDGYFWIRISERNWKELHRVIWEQHYGPAPEGFKITFRDGNKLNCEIDNLDIISNADNMLRNSVHNYPEQLRDTIMTLGALKRKIRQYEEQH